HTVRHGGRFKIPSNEIRVLPQTAHTSDAGSGVGSRFRKAKLVLRPQSRNTGNAGCRGMHPAFRRPKIKSNRALALTQKALTAINLNNVHHPMTRVAPQIKIPATYMRGGTSKGVFFRLQDLPEAAQQPGAVRDALLLRVLGSPDPYGKQIDGMGNASSSTSKAVILSQSTRPGHDVDYLFGQVSIDQPLVDWSGNCGNLSAAVGPCAIHLGLTAARRMPHSPTATIR